MTEFRPLTSGQHASNKVFYTLNSDVCSNTSPLFLKNRLKSLNIICGMTLALYNPQERCINAQNANRRSSMKKLLTILSVSMITSMLILPASLVKAEGAGSPAPAAPAQQAAPAAPAAPAAEKAEAKKTEKKAVAKADKKAKKSKKPKTDKAPEKK